VNLNVERVVAPYRDSACADVYVEHDRTLKAVDFHVDAHRDEEKQLTHIMRRQNQGLLLNFARPILKI